ncbi:ABC transporter permease [Saccharopolyspora griseoalba]|uniref:ABC transporter permease n=1 Tax=Saccharopolyspora griseoalba TaxID=1431848 RepID=A0ABW2LHI1_9PSEU
MLNPFTRATRRAGGSVGKRTWLGLILVPVLIVGLLGFAFWAPMSAHGSAKVAVVNADEPTEIDGQLAPLGREMAAKLVNSTDTGYDWQITDSSDAEDGLASGHYAAAVFIPEEFSSNTASAMTGEPMDATRADVRVRTSPAADPADAAAVDAAARKSVARFNRQIVEQLLDGFYGGFAQMHDQMGSAVDGARQLADGSDQLADGAGQLAGGTSELATGSGQLADGAHQLAGGSQQLAGGLGQLYAQVEQMPEQTDKLADGAEQVAAGNRQMADQFVPLADKIITVTDKMPTESSAAESLAQLADRCAPSGTSLELCRKLREQAEALQQREGALDSLKQQIQQPAKQMKQGMEGLAHGSEQVAEGNRMLAENSQQLVDGIGQLNAGAQQLAGGSGQLAGGLDQFHGGVQQLDSGAQQLAGGSQQVAEGNRQMADQMGAGVDDIPNYDEAERAHLKEVAASPAALESSLPGFGKSLIALLVAIAFWTAALGVYAVTRAIPGDAATSRKSTWRLVLSSLAPGAAVATVAAIAVSAALAPFLGLGFGSWAAFAGVTLLAALAFVAVNQALVAVLGSIGRVVSIAVLVLAAATGVISTVPGVLETVGALLPTRGAVQALSAIVTGGTGAAGGIAQLLGWLVAGVLVFALAVDRARTVPARDLRRTLPTPTVRRTAW